MINRIKTIIAFAVISAALIFMSGCSSSDKTEDTIECLDTQCTISIYDMKQSDAEAIIDKAFKECRRLEGILSRTAKGSDVYLINSAEGKPVEVSDDTINVIKKGLYYSEMSEGDFDITVGRITELWDFKAEHPSVPDKQKLADAVETVGYEHVAVNGNSVKLDNPETKIELGGIAKGYIADRLEELLREEGVSKAIINLGGNVVTIGAKSEKEGWRIGIERPYSDRTEIIGAVELTDETIVTSGVYERMFVIDGKLYHHILNPKTGYPSEGDVEAVSIRAEDGHSVDCDALSTICILKGSKKGKKIIEELDGFEASFIDKNDNITETDGMKLELIEE